jgi:DNA-binding beta-propeller fold protein YncE
MTSFKIFQRLFFVSKTLILVFLLLNYPLYVTSTTCSTSTYSYGGSGSCASCSIGSTFISSTAGCSPSTSPVDTSFYLSATMTEGVSAFSTINSPLGISYTSNVFGIANSAITLSSGSYLSAIGTTLPDTLPIGNTAWSISAWVKCTPPETNSYAGVLEWGLPGDSSGALSTQTAAIVVVGTNVNPFVGTVTTLAGSAGQPGSTDGQGAAARFKYPWGVVVDSLNNIYVADNANHVIRKITPDGFVSTFAGSALQTGSTDGQGAAARFNYPDDVSVDSSGNVYVTDQHNHIIRKITTGGSVSTIAGSAGQTGSTDGQGAAARFKYPAGIAVDSSGNIYVADRDNHIIRKIASDGSVSTLAGSAGQIGSTDGQGAAARFKNPYGVAVDSSGNVYVADTSNHIIRKITPGGLVSTFAGSTGQNGFADGEGVIAKFHGPFRVAVDLSGNVYVADADNHLIRKITRGGLVSTLAGSAGQSGSTDGQGAAAEFYYPYGVAVDSSGNVYVGDHYKHLIRKISFAFRFPVCDQTWHHTALTYSPSSLKTYIDGSLFESGSSSATITLPLRSSSTLRIGWNGISNTPGSLFTGSLSDMRIYSRTLTSSDVNVLKRGCSTSTYSYGGSGSCASCSIGSTFISSTAGCSPSTSPVDTSFYLSATMTEGVSAFSTINSPLGISYTSNVFGIANSAITLSSGSYLSAIGTTLPDTLPIGNTAWSISAWVKCTPPETNSYAGVLEWGLPGDSSGALSTQTAAIVVVGTNVNPFVGTVTTLAGRDSYHASTDGQGAAARFNYPDDVSVDSSGNVYVADQNNHIIRKITPGGSVSTIAGSAGQIGSADGQGAAARFKYPAGIAVDSSGNIYVADRDNHIIRKIASDGSVTTLAGSAGQIESTDGQGAAARFNYPYGVAVDSSGNVYVADTSNHIIRKITPNGLVKTIAGSALQTGSTDGLGTAARLANPTGIALDASNNIYISDKSNCVIRKFSSDGKVSTIAGIAGESGSSDGQGAAARFRDSHYIAVDSWNNIYVTDRSSHIIRKISPDGLVSTIAGSAGQWGSTDGHVTSARFNYPSGIAVDSSNNLYVADTQNSIIRKILSAIYLNVCDQTWHHTALTYSPSSLKTYIDGSIFALGSSSATITLPPRSSSTLRIGWNGISNTPGSLFSGSLSDLRIYSRTLSPSEVESLSQPSAASFPGLHLSLLSSSPKGGTFLFTCIAGYAGPIAILSKSQPDNSYSWSITPSCVQCPAGTFSQQGAISCTFCSPGTYSLSGSSYCSLCPAGTYGNRAGLTSTICSGQCSTPADCPTGTAYPPSSSSTLSCATNTARALPNDLNMRLWPAAHPLNTDRVDKIVAPEETCKTMLSLQTCVGRTSVVINGVTRYVIGTAAELNMEASEELLCDM